MAPVVKFKKTHPDAKLPTYETLGAAGADLRSVEYGYILPGDRILLQTGLDCDIPKGFELQVRPRSGLAYKNGVTVLNAPGTIDSDYKGPLGVILVNNGAEPFEVKLGDRIAQIVVAPVVQATFMAVDEVGTSERGAGGFGSTGVA